MRRRAAILGLGVIGRGWTCRFLLHGWDVSVYDPDPKAQQQLGATLERARAALHAVYGGKVPVEGTFEFMPDACAAISEADWVQESLPEEIAIKRSCYQQIESSLRSGVPLASSTSGFKPSVLAQDLACAAQMLVCHPFNPVYLLPAVEVVPGTETSPTIVTTSEAVLRSIGMYPVTIHHEIDAHIADRLLEALWREALWLVRDGVATTGQIDEVMRHGFGLRWAQMGLFETYRLGGGEAGMRAFLKQFGPALQWPWSRLTDVPAMDAELIELIATQSDAQSGHLSISELEQQRDTNLVAILRALKVNDTGAGQTINRFLQATH